MKEEINIELSNGFIEAIQYHLENKEELLLVELKSKEFSIEEMLNNYYYGEKGKVFNHSVEKDSIQFRDATTGTFTIQYSINYSNGCQDISYNEKDKRAINFEIDLGKGTMKLIGEYIPERMPDEF